MPTTMPPIERSFRNSQMATKTNATTAATGMASSKSPDITLRPARLGTPQLTQLLLLAGPIVGALVSLVLAWYFFFKDRSVGGILLGITLVLLAVGFLAFTLFLFAVRAL